MKGTLLIDHGNGTILLQAPGYTHVYSDMMHMAHDLKHLADGADPSADGWAGDQPEYRMSHQWLLENSILSKADRSRVYTIGNLLSLAARYDIITNFVPGISYVPSNSIHELLAQLSRC